MRKLLYCIADGMADVPGYCTGGITPLQAADTPMLDMMARHAVTGLCHTIPETMPPDSDVGNLALMGYDPRIFKVGRGPIEALGIGLNLAPDDLVWRLSLVCTEGRGDEAVMRDAQGCGVSDATARRLVAQFDEAVQKISEGTLRIYHNESYRHILVQSGGADHPEATSFISQGPHRLLGERILPYVAAYPALLREALRCMNAVAAHDTTFPDTVWLWGQGKTPNMPSFAGKHGLNACMISGVSLLRGLGRAADMVVIEDSSFTGLPGTNLAAKAQAAVRYLSDGGDVAFIHVDAPDHCAHCGDAEGKQTAIEAFDRQLLTPLKAAQPDAVYVVTCDHCTSSLTRTHERGPVPFLIHREGLDFSPGDTFSEESCCGLGDVPSGPELLELAKRFL